LEARSVNYERIDDGQVTFDFDKPAKWLEYSVVLERSISYARGLYTTQILNAWASQRSIWPTLPHLRR